MRPVLSLLAVIVAAVLLAACGGDDSTGVERDDTVRPANIDGRTAGAPTTLTPRSQRGTGTLANSQQLPVAMRRLLKPHQLPDDLTLPPLPQLQQPEGKLPAATATLEKLGSDAFDYSEDSATITGDQIILSDLSASVSWAIYELGAISPYAEPRTLRVELSAAGPGDPDDYWIGVADYERDSWEIIANSATLTYSRPLTDASRYRSPSGYVYVFVLVTEGQSVIVDRVALDIDTPAWIEVELDSASETSYTPALAFAQNGNPVVAYSSEGFPRIAIGDRSKDLRQAAGWTLADINPQPSGPALWLDLIIDPATGYPNVSLAYVGLGEGANNSRAGFSPMADDPEHPEAGPLFLNYELDLVDGAVYTSIDRRNDGFYGIAMSAANTFSAKPSYDMELRLIDFDPLAWGTTVDYQTTYNFGDNWRFPHLRFHPVEGGGTVCINGGYVQFESTVNIWDEIFREENSSPLGSLAYNPLGNTLGSTFQHVEGNLHELNYVPFKDGMFADPPQPIDWLPAEPGNYVGAASQLAFMPDGSPAIAYSWCDGERIIVKYAHKNGAIWDVEDASTDPSVPSDFANTILLDLAIDAAGVPAIVYNHLQGTSSTLHYIMRGS